MNNHETANARVGQFSGVVLAAINSLRTARAYPVNIWDRVEEFEGRRVSSGSLYRTLDLLKNKGLVDTKTESVEGEAKVRTHYKLTPTGIQSLASYRSRELAKAEKLKAFANVGAH